MRLAKGLFALALACAPAAAAKAQETADRARALNQQGLDLYLAQHYDQAEKLLTEAMQICDGPLQGEHFCVAGVGENLADVARARGDLPSAERYLKRSADVTRATTGRTPQLGKIDLKLGGVLLQELKYAEAEVALTSGLQIAMATGDAAGSLTGAINLGEVYLHTARPAAAETLLRQVLAACPNLGPGCEPLMHAHLGSAMQAQDRVELAEAELSQAAELFGAAGSLEERDNALLTIARIQRDSGRLGRATLSLQALVQNLRHRPATSPPSPVLLALSQAELAQILVADGHRQEAEPWLRSAQGEVEAGHLSAGDAATVGVRVAAVHALLGREPEARATLAKVMATPNPLGISAPAWRAEAEGLLGDLSYGALQFEAAEAHYRASAAAFAANGSPGERRARLNSAAQALLDQRRYAEGDALLESLLAEARAQTPPDENGIVNLEANLARSRNDQGDPKAALALASDALARYRPPPERPQAKPVGVLAALGTAELGLGRYDLAQTHLSAAVAAAEADGARPVAYWNAQALLCDAFFIAGKFDAEKTCADRLRMFAKALPAPQAAQAQVLLLIHDGNARFNADALGAAAAAYRQAVELAASRPDIPMPIRAGAYVSLGQAYGGDGQPVKARDALERALALFGKAGVGQEEPAIEALRRLADVERDLGMLPRAEARARIAVEWFERNRDPEHPRAPAQLRSLGLTLMAQGRASEAEPLLQRALDILQAQLAPNAIWVAQSLSDLAACKFALGRLDAGRELAGKIEGAEAAARGQTSWYVGAAARVVGELEFEGGRFSEAAGAFQRADALLARGGLPALPDQLALHGDVAALRLQQGRFADARRELERGLAKASQAYGSDSPKLIGVLMTLAALDTGDGRFEAAEAGYRRVLALQAKTTGDQSPVQMGPWLELAGLKALTLRFTEAQVAIDRVQAIAKDSGMADGPSAVGLKIRLAVLEAWIDRPEAARDFAGRALAIARAAPGDATRLQIEALAAAGFAAWRAGALDEAAGLLSESLTKADALWGAGSLPTVGPMLELAAVDREQRRFGEAGALLDRASVIAARTLPERHALNVLILLELAETRRAAGDVETAERLAKEALARLAENGRTGGPMLGYAQFTLSGIYGAEGLADEAERSIQKARDFLGVAPAR